ncbi:ATP-binding cassette, subfamily B [Acrasis kona]|uniref:ATP-binding cassette, subfamily B n=1 Tax=Acrasis kona TaxID=1008807 RepID=A0AAW2YL14_9EUKA
MVKVTPHSPNHSDEKIANNEELVHKSEESVLVDPHEPKISSPLAIIGVFGVWNMLLVLTGMFWAAGSGVIPLAFFQVMGNGFGNISSASSQEILDVTTTLATNVAYVALASAVAGFASNFTFTIARQRMINKLKQKYFDSCMQQEIGFFDIKKSGSLAHSLSDDCSKSTDVFSTHLQTFTQNLIQFFVGFVMAMVAGWSMCLLIVASIPITTGMMFFIRRLLAYLATKISLLTSDSVSTANEVISSMRTVRSMAGEEKEVQRYVDNTNKITKFALINSFVKACAMGPTFLFMWGFVSLGFWFGGTQLENKNMDIGAFLKVFGLSLMSIIGLSQSMTVFPEFVKAQASAVLLLKVIKRKPAIKFRGGLTPDNMKGHIQFKNITFRYPSRPEVAVLKNFSLEIQAGTSVALVGQSGSGKSTIVGLVEKWYEPEEGHVLIDGDDIQNIDSIWLHRYLGIVSQEPTLFATTIGKNISYAVDTINGHIKEANKHLTEDQIQELLIPVTEDTIIKASVAANCHSFITKLPEGYDTVLGERGVSLSGGQKQRIAIARAYLQNPKVLLLDEATSALDTKSEALVQEALNKLMVGRTSIVIAHRLTTVQDCDNIVVMKRGSVVESGTHQQMLKNVGGPYHTLASKQMKFGEEEKNSQTQTPTSNDHDEIEEIQVTNEETVEISEQLIKAPIAKAKSIRKPKKKANIDNFTNEDEPIDIHEPKSTNPFGFVFMIGFQDSFILLLGVVASCCIGITPILNFFILGSIISSASPSRNADGSFIPFPPGYSISAIVSTNAGYIAIIALAAGLSQFFSVFLMNLSNERISVRIKRLYFEAITRQEMGFFDAKKTGKLLASISDDTQGFAEGITLKAQLFFQHISQFVAGIIFALTASWKVGLVVLGAGIPTIGSVIFVSAMILNKLAAKESESSSSAIATSTEVIGAIRTVRSMAGEEREMRRFGNDLKKIQIFGIIRACVLGAMMSLMQFFIWGDAALCFWYGGQLIANGEIASGKLYQVFGNMLFGVLGASMALAEIQHFYKAGSCIKEIMKVTKRKPAIPSRGGITPPKIDGILEFKNISFSYPTRPNVTVMKNFNLSIKKGQHVALVGESGCGKSTITGLIMRFYEPNTGQVYLDGNSINEIDPYWIHKNVAIVTQEPVLFATTIRKNITYAVGDENFTQEEVEKCAKDANCHEFIMSLPNGYETMVGERGVSMSGGQKQRIAIARAMIQNSSLLLLDEATSALDTEAESLVQSALDKLMVGKTSIVIAHRLSTIKDCDVIVAMRSGEVIEMGTHDELVSKKGMYYKLAQKQMQFGQKSSSQDNINITEDD